MASALIGLLACLLCAFWFIVFRNNSLEDAYITFRYARHLAAGYPYGAWNLDGSRVDGSTSLLWTWWIAAGFRAGVPPLVWASLSSYALLLLLFGALLFVGQRASDSLVDPLDAATRRRAVFLLAAYVPVHWYATTGMEAVAFMALGGLTLLFASIRDRWAPGAFTCCAVLLVLARPEGVILVFGALLVALARSNSIDGIRDLRRGAILALAVAIALAVYRKYSFGDWVPNTYFAKASGFSMHRLLLGAQYVWYFVQIAQLGIALVLAAILSGNSVAQPSPRRRSLLALSAFIATYAVYVLYAGGDEFSAFPFWRHFVHVFVFVVAAVALAIGALVPSRIGAALLTLIVAIVPNAQIFTLGPPADGGQSLRERIRQTAASQSRQEEYFDWVARLSTRNTLIATSLAGRFPYAVDATFVDMLGLNDSYIAHHGTIDPQGPLDSKTDGAYVLGRRPEIIEGYMRASAVAAGDLKTIYRGRPKMIAEIVRDPRFQADYCFATGAPYRAMDRALFLRRDFARLHGLIDAQCVSIPSTVLATPSATTGPLPPSAR